MARSGATAALPVERFFQFAILGFVASGFLAVAGSGFLDLPTTLLMTAALLIRTLYAAGLIYYRIPTALVTFATIAYVAVYAIDEAWLSRAFVPATVHLIFFLAIVKVLTATTTRDYFFLKLVAFLELLTACVLSSRLNFFLFLVVFLVLGVATFTSSEIRRSSLAGSNAVRAPVAPGFRRRLVLGNIFMTAGILLLTGALFFVLPRTARAAFHGLASNRFHIPGFADSVTLGEIGEIKRSDSPVMHIRMDYAADQRFPLKWRGAALSEFDGRRWYNVHGFEEALRPDRTGELRLAETRRRNRFSRRISYTVHLNEIASNVLFFSGRPEFMRIDAPLVLRSWSGNYRFIYRAPGAVAYEVVSAVDVLDGENETDPDTTLAPESKQLYLQLPQIDPRIAPLARSITSTHSDELSRARAIEKHLRTSYGYTLELPSSEPRDPLANFLFDRRKGHCEYFASAMAVMLRSIGIPSRVVTGFGPGVYNPVSGRQIIRASDAHSWVEAYVGTHGWTTFDPTPADPNPPATSFWARLGFYIDAAETFWQDWILNYNLDRQAQLASRVGETGERIRVNWFENIGPALSKWKNAVVKFARSYGVILVCLTVVVILVWRFGKDLRTWFVSRGVVKKVSRGEAHASDATLLYSRMLKLLKRRGIEKPAWLTPLEFARVITEQELSLLVHDFTDAYYDLRFGREVEAAPRMTRILERLHHRG